MQQPARPDLAALRVEQFGVATRLQLRQLGLSQGQLDAQLDGRRWRQVSATVIVMHNGPMTKQQQWTAAVLTAEAPAGLAARTAAQAAGLTGWEVEVIHVLVRRGAKINPIDELPIKVHESRRFDACDIRQNRFPPQVGIERAVIDAAAWSGSHRTACGIVAASVQQRLTTADRLLDTLMQAGKIRHHRLLSAVLTDIDGGAHAVSELDFLRFCRRHGFPRPALQVRVDAKGRRRYLDAEFVRRDGRKLGVEIDGAVHLVAQTYWQDMERGNDLILGGRRVLRFPSSAIYADDPVAVAQLASALGLPPLSERGRAIARRCSDRSPEVG